MKHFLNHKIGRLCGLYAMLLGAILSGCGGQSIVTTQGTAVGSQMGGARQGTPMNLAGAVTTFSAGTATNSAGLIGSKFSTPSATATDGTNLYVADTASNTIRKVVIATGAVSTLAGSGAAGSTDGTGVAASFSQPSAIAISPTQTTLYVADSNNHKIRQIVIATGAVTTLAGAGTPPLTAVVDGIGVAAYFNNPTGITIDSTGTNLYVADTGNNTIRQIVIASATVTTIAGSGTWGQQIAIAPSIVVDHVGPSLDGVGIAATFKSPSGIAISPDGANLYVADTLNNTIRKIVIAGAAVTTLAGSGNAGAVDATGIAASFSGPSGISTDGTNLYVTDSGNNKIRKVVIASGVVTTFSGSGTAGRIDGTGASAAFNGPAGITSDGTNLYVADKFNNALRKVAINTAAVSTLASSTNLGPVNGTGAAATFNLSSSVTSDGTNLYVADTGTNTIRKIVIATGAVTTFAGSGAWGTTDGVGTAASFKGPSGITSDGTNLYVSDTFNNKIRKIVIATGAVTTLAGSGVWGSTSGTSTGPSVDGTGTAASFKSPAGIATDGTNVYVADTANHAIRKIVIATGVVTTLAGTGGVAGTLDGIGAAANFSSPSGITIDSTGTNLYVADTGNDTIRQIVIATGTVTTLAGTAAVPGFADGTGLLATFFDPADITTDGTNLYVSDKFNNKIRQIVIATGVVTSLTGTASIAGVAGSADGAGAAATFFNPQGIVRSGANLYVVDKFNNTIRQIVIATGVVSTLAGSAAPVQADLLSVDLNGFSITTDGGSLYIADASRNIIRKVDMVTGTASTLAGSGTKGATNGTGTAASFNNPSGITTDGRNLYVTDTGNNLIRKIDLASNAVTTLAGSGSVGSANGSSTAASFNSPYGITTDGTSLYVADTRNNTIRKIVIATAAVTTLAGSGTAGAVNGLTTAASFNLPSGITTDGVNLYVADTRNNTIRKIVIATGAVTTLAGSGNAGATNGIATAASFNLPSGISSDGANLYVADMNNNLIRKVAIATQTVTTVAGSGATGALNGTGLAASFNLPSGITTDGINLYLTDSTNCSVRKIN
jgi:DNA-binding beta-propeller fold protein YncE